MLETQVTVININLEKKFTQLHKNVNVNVCASHMRRAPFGFVHDIVI